MERTLAYLRLHLARGLGLRAAHELLAATGDPRAVPAMRRADLRARSIPADAISELTGVTSLEAASREYERASEYGIRIIHLEQEDYPLMLRETATPPLVLYVRGAAWNPARPHIALVGARRASPYGVNAAESLAQDLARSGLVVTSGLARGIDAAAHRGALAGGTTVAVFGTGLDRIYPEENSALAEQIVANGAIISEFRLGACRELAPSKQESTTYEPSPVCKLLILGCRLLIPDRLLGTPPLRAHFPRRNRILAGMTLGTVVVEAKERSGSLITARMALDANREVFAVPGPIQSDKSRGPNLLIRQGAVLVSRWQDIVEELPGTLPGPAGSANDGDGSLARPLPAPQRRVLDALSEWNEVAIDMLLGRLDLPAGEVYRALFELELADRIRKLPGELYIKRR